MKTTKKSHKKPMMQSLSTRTLGSSAFTIMDLLLVVTILTTIAAISAVAYTLYHGDGNDQRISAAKSWRKTINLYTAENTKYPDGMLGSHVCLGYGNPTNWDKGSEEDCYLTDDVKHPSDAVNTALGTIDDSPPAFPMQPLPVSESQRSGGISLRALDTLERDGVSKPYYPMLVYWLEGRDQDCILRPLVVAKESGYVIDKQAKNSGAAGSNTACRIALLDPARL